MSQTLQDANRYLEEGTNSSTLPFAVHLDLKVIDPDTIRELTQHAEGADRDEFALEALKIGVLALRRASSSFDADYIKRETDRLLDTMRRQLEDHTRGSQEKLAGALKHYFDPESGQFNRRVQQLTAKDGELSSLLSESLDGDKSKLAQTLFAHFGEQSPLMKILSPDQSNGLLATLRTNVEGELSKQRERILQEFSLDNPNSALTRLIEQLTSKHGSLSKDLQGKIDEVIKEFSLDKEDSALNRLVTRVNRAQETITREFSLDNDQSSLKRMKTELTTILEAHVKTNAEFQEEVKIALEKLDTKRKTELRSTTHGNTFEDAVLSFLHDDAARRGDVVEATGNCTGLRKNCKVGDAVVELGPDHVAAGAKIVLEAKEDASYTLKKARDEVAVARSNRDAQQGIFVFSRHSAPPEFEALARYGDDVFVVWDAQDPQTDAYLKAALEISRALCLRSNPETQRDTIDWTPIDKSVLDIEKRAENLEMIRKSAETILSSGGKIIDRVDKDKKGLLRQFTILSEAMSHIKELLGEP
ncbi:hypothetical protein [Adhaeretor mobilis]|uniref:Uncharacterized protein n=1 Tax=Adhaeretor mobilis TaxID=1930276 RepID=A0A517MQL6_9BACT|nr:hypothetical protein [Adhaeretor mobilis]QDS97176.1 hypothetical protein HG15A2_04360 [Adhaeretor mobilis]